MKPQQLWGTARWGLVAVGVAAMLATSPLVWKAGVRAARSVSDWRVGRFLEQASEAERAGRWREADVALASALAMKADSRALQIRRADFLLRAGRGDEGVAAWRGILGRDGGRAGRELTLAFAARLIMAGRFPELADLAIGQLQAAGTDRGLWLNLAAEAGRLAPGGLTSRELARIASQPVQTIVGAYALLGSGDAARVRTTLADADGRTTSEAAALLAARTWVAVGDQAQARLALARTVAAYRPESVAAHEVLLARGEAGVTVDLLRRLLEGEGVSPEVERRIALFTIHGMPHACEAAAVELTRRLRESVPQLTSEALAGVWLYCGLAGAEESERFWRERLGARIGTTLPPLAGQSLTVPLLRIIVERAPLPLELVCGLMAETRREAALLAKDEAQPGHRA